MMNRSFLMNILIEYIKDTILSNEENIDKDYIYKMIINPNYSTDNTLESINDNSTVFDNWIRYFKYEKNVIALNKNEYFSINSNNYDKKYLPGSIKLYIPINKNKIEISVKKIFDFLMKEKIMHCSKVFSTVRNDNIVIRIFDVNNIEKIVKFVTNNEYIKSGLMDLSPFVTTYNGVGLAIDLCYSYHNIVASNLYKYFLYLKENDKIEHANLENFKDFLIEDLKNIKDANLRLIIEFLIENLDGNTKLETIYKYNEKTKINIINKVIFNIYSIYEYDKTLNIIQKYNNILNCNIDSEDFEKFKLFIDKNFYNKIINNEYDKILNEIIYKESGYTKQEIEKLYLHKKNNLYKIICETFKKNNCYQEIKMYLKEYVTKENFDNTNTWLTKIDNNINVQDIKNIIKRELRLEEINDDNIELFINNVLINDYQNIPENKYYILKNSIINTYDNRTINNERFIKDAIKQYILIDKINGFTNDNESRKKVIENISPYECFYIICNKDNSMLLDSMIDNYVNDIMPYLYDKEYDDNDKCKFLENITKELLCNNTISYTIESLKLCLLGSVVGIKDYNKFIMEKCIGHENILKIIKKILKKYDQEILEDDESIIVASYVDYISNIMNLSI